MINSDESGGDDDEMDDVEIIISSGDDTDCEDFDEYKQLDPKVLEVHLNCSSESGKSVVSVEKDLEIVGEKYKEVITSNSEYNNSKYFNKKKFDPVKIVKNIDGPKTNNSIKKLKMENTNDDVIVISDDEGDEENKADTKVDIKNEIDNLGHRDKELLGKLAQIRRWKLTGLGNALRSGEKKPCKTDLNFRVLSYNILAQKNLTGHLNLYRGKPQYLLDWEYRWTGIQREVLDYSPDIVTFQEVQFSEPDHFSHHIKPWFAREGFEAISQCRTGDKHDGCAIFFRSAKFSLVSSTGVLYRQTGVPVLDKDNVGIVCCLRGSNGSRLVVATTHLLFNPKRHEIRLAQTAVLLAELDRVAWDQPSQGYLPVILTGDLNLQPFSDTYNLLTRGSVSCAGWQYGQATAGWSSLGIADTCQRVEELTRRAGREVTPQVGTGAFSHQFGLRSVYNHSRHQDSRVPVGGYEATTKHSSWVTVDYIFYSTVQSSHSASKDGRAEGNLKLVGRLALLTGPEISALGGLPSAICPSDHLPLLAEFCLKV